MISNIAKKKKKKKKVAKFLDVVLDENNLFKPYIDMTRLDKV